MAVTEKKNIWFYAGAAPEVRTYKIAASQGALMPGAPLELNANGVCELSDTDDVQILGYLVGAKNKATAWPLAAELAANTEIEVAVVQKDQIWAVYCDNNDSDSAAAQTVVGDRVGIRVSSLSGAVGYVTADLNETSTVMFQVIDLLANKETEKFAVADNPGVILVKHIGTLQG